MLLDRRLLRAVALAACVGCTSRRAEVIDLSCDQIIYDASQARYSFRVQHGMQIDAQLAARGLGKVVVRTTEWPGTFPLRHGLRARTRQVDSSRVALARSSPLAAMPDRPPIFRVPLRDSTERTEDGGFASMTLERPSGLVALWFRCINCADADTVHHFVAGRTDSIELRVTGYPNSCEAARLRPE
jgi:hypothetical protein